jgi:hypothetical protein
MTPLVVARDLTDSFIITGLVVFSVNLTANISAKFAASYEII